MLKPVEACILGERFAVLKPVEACILGERFAVLKPVEACILGERMSWTEYFTFNYMKGCL